MKNFNNLRILLVFSLVLLFSVTDVNAQVRVASTAGTPDVNAMLDIVSTNKGILIPRITQANRPAAPTTGMLIYQTNNTPGFYYYDGSNWVRFSAGNEAWKTIGNAGTSPATNFLGTTDNQDFVIKTNDVERLRVNGENNAEIGFIGIGTNNPSYPLTVVSATEDVTGAFFNTEASQDNYGVYGGCSTTDYFGYGGVFVGGYTGGYGRVSATGSNAYFGLMGRVTATGAGSNYGVYGIATGTGSNYGVTGMATTSTTTVLTGNDAGGLFNAEDIGVLAITHTANGIGVFGIGGNVSGTSSINGSGGVFNGVDVGSYSLASAGTGTGATGVANGAALSTLVSGSGGAFTGSSYGVYGNATNNRSAAGGYFSNGNGCYASVAYTSAGGTDYKIFGSGSVSTIVETPDKKDAVTLFCPEAPEILFQDYGSGKLINGKAHINIDPILAHNLFVSDKHPLRVFIQLEGNCKGVYVTNKTANGFDVVELQEGNSNVNFSWSITANRKDRTNSKGEVKSKHVGVRFPTAPKMQETITPEVKIMKVENSDEDMPKKEKDIK